MTDKQLVVSYRRTGILPVKIIIRLLYVNKKS